uniref:RING-type E3 ubiquitin transferase n=1 Tax=Echinococcus granulosus TaxID=6210 RepID=A0A068WCT8_ECHGR|nr:zinc finger protein [Echinococcus granulosus]
MASANVGGGRYYCHVCQRRASPVLQDSTLRCNFCNQGFVEELDPNDMEWVMTEFDVNPDVPPIPNFVAAMQSALGNITVGFTSDEPVSANTRSRAQRRPEMMMGGIELFMQMLLNADLNRKSTFNIGGPPPATPSDIASLPRKTLSQADLKTYDVCSICLEKFSVDDEILTLPCLHGFHQSCLSTWLSQKGSCPICRKDMQGQDTSCLFLGDTPLNLNLSLHAISFIYFNSIQSPC